MLTAKLRNTDGRTPSVPAPIKEQLRLTGPASLALLLPTGTGHIQVRILEHDLCEERLKQLLGPTFEVTQKAAAPHQKQATGDRRLKPVRVIAVDASSPAADLIREGDEFPSMSAFAEAVGSPLQCVAPAMTYAKGRKDKTGGYPQARVKGVTFMFEEDYLLWLAKDTDLA